MKEPIENEYIKRTQKDYSYTFKLQVVQEYESGNICKGELRRKYGIQGDATIRNWIEKYGTCDFSNKSLLHMSKSAEQKLMELEQKVRLLEKQKKSLEKQVEQSDKKAIIFDMMIDLAEKEYKSRFEKTPYPNNRKLQRSRTRKLNSYL
jgi:transposase-like protein